MRAATIERAARGLAGMLLLAGAAACLAPAATPCADGSLCSSDQACAPGGGCATPDQLAACAGAVDDAPCEVDGLDGACRGEVCELFACGDGAVNGAEDCEGADLGGATCADLGYYQGTLACGGNCRFDERGCAERCGDGQINGAELCDGAAPSEDACVDFGYQLGPVACSAACGADLTACERIGWRGQALPLLGESFTIADAQGVADGVVAVGAVAGGDARPLVLEWDGNAWTERPIPGASSALALTDVFALAPGEYLVAGDGADGSELWRASGGDWTQLALPVPALFINRIWAADPTTIFLATTDGMWHLVGETWSQPSFETGGPLNGLWGLAADEVYALPMFGLLQRWDGVAWTEVHQPEFPYLEHLVGTASDDIWAFGWQGAWLHYDGSSWKEGVMPAGRILSAWSAGPRDVLIVDDEDEVWRFDGTGWGQVLDVHGNGVVTGVGARRWVFGPLGLEVTDGSYWMGRDDLGLGYSDRAPWILGDDVWTVRYDGAVLRGGVETGLEETGLRQVAAPTSTLAIAIGTAGRIREWDGATWTDVDVDTDQDLVAVTAWPDGAAVAVGLNGTVVQRSAGGGWSVATAPTSADLLGVWGPGAGEVVVVGEGVVLTHRDGAWTDVSPADAPTLAGAYGASLDDFWVVGEGLFHFEQGAWTSVSSGGVLLRSVAGRAADDIFAVGQQRILHYDGNRWSPVEAPAPDATVYAVAVSADHTIIAADRAYALRRDAE
jgi:hypothetical protein